ncbi:MAG: Na+/H+ antiporter subunit G [Pseudonocardiaceae bacterium]|nr:Na+/H+ antiporter subunit G [Pseudonocardiaceae bacterium]
MSVISGLLLLVGSLIAVLAGLGLVRFPDVLTRLQAATKLQVPGLGLILLGAALAASSVAEVALLLLVAVFQTITAPVLGQVLGRAAARTGEVRSDLLVEDESTPP